MEITNQRSGVAHIVWAAADFGYFEAASGVLTVMRTISEPASLNSFDLFGSCRGICRIRIGHGLDKNGRPSEPMMRWSILT